ncbi:hypothetical protein TCAL_16329 [Tigriopus californicus]|uniref:Uncharacterized protein n=1 Tax=Tigriopus californicus TaxID=6832 RepID=A0A553N663_TIGCA|nr:hypothetical protein TCAL_16329 [Tigriopus californicus]
MPTAICHNCESHSNAALAFGRKNRIAQLLSSPLPQYGSNSHYNNGHSNNNNNNNNHSSPPRLPPISRPPSTPSPPPTRGRERGRSRAKARRKDSISAAVKQRALSVLRPNQNRLPRSPSPPPVKKGGSKESMPPCSHCQPRYSDSPEKLGLRPTLSIFSDDLQPDSNSIHMQYAPPEPKGVWERAIAKVKSNQDQNLNPAHSAGSAKNRRARSEVRTRTSGPLRSNVNEFYASDFKGNQKKSNESTYGKENANLKRTLSIVAYAEPSEGGRHHRPRAQLRRKARMEQTQKQLASRSKSRSRTSHAHLEQSLVKGTFTIWPGKEGIWLPFELVAQKKSFSSVAYD